MSDTRCQKCDKELPLGFFDHARTLVDDAGRIICLGILCDDCLRSEFFVRFSEPVEIKLSMQKLMETNEEQAKRIKHLELMISRYQKCCQLVDHFIDEFEQLR